MRCALFACVLLCSACPRPEPVVMPKLPPPPPRVMNVPPGCLANFGGHWRHADDQTWRYTATDDGGTLQLLAFRVFPKGGTDGGIPAAPAARVTLERTEDGFSGTSVADVLHPTGRICSAEYPTLVQSCSDGGLVLRAAAAVSLGDGCQTPLPPRSPVMLEHRLVRADP
jgi:hypothetical protein